MTGPEAGEQPEQTLGPDENEIQNSGRDERVECQHPLIGALIGAQSLEVKQPEIDDADHIYQLEVYFEGLDYTKNWFLQPDLTPVERALAPLYSPMHAVDDIGNQFATKIMPALLRPDAEAALEAFRAVTPNTVDEEMLLLTNDEQFMKLHEGLHDHLTSHDATIRQTAQDRVGEIKQFDRMQFSGNMRRSLETMHEQGMTISIDQAGAEAIAEADHLAGDGILPLTEYVKNEKILTISGFEGSKISLAVHDFMDHFWTFDVIRKSGLLDRYSSMFASIGNPELTDIYKREGEIVASIAFGVRLFQTLPSAFGPLMRTSDIEEHLDDLFVAGKLEARHLDAYRTVKQLRKGSMEWQSLGFAFSNYITELDEQRRKYGKIKQRDPQTRKVQGELDPLAADYLCFFIDTHHEILLSKNKHLNDLFRFQILMEEYLSGFANGSIPADQPMRIKLDELQKLDFSKTTLPPQRLAWIRKNYGFTATRSAMV